MMGNKRIQKVFGDWKQGCAGNKQGEGVVVGCWALSAGRVPKEVRLLLI